MTRRSMGALLLLAGLAWAGKTPLEFVGDKEKAQELARTRGKLIFLTVIVDHDADNRAVVAEVFRNPGFRKMAPEFVLLYANPENEHGLVSVTDKSGRRVSRCADCPAMTCAQHIALAQHYARGFFPDNNTRTPVHFLIDAEENVVEVIGNGSFKSGFTHMTGKAVTARLRRALKKHGRGLSEQEYKRMRERLANAKAARARGATKLALEHLGHVVALNRKIAGVTAARALIRKLEEEAARKLTAIESQVAKQEWEAALDGLKGVIDGYPGTLSAGVAAKKRKELLAQKPVKQLLKAARLYERAEKYKAAGKVERWREKLTELVRKYPQTRYAELARAALGGKPSAGGPVRPG